MRYAIIISDINKVAYEKDLYKAVKVASQIRSELDTEVKVFDTLIGEYVEF